LTGFTVASSSQYYSSLDGVLFDKGQTLLIQYPIKDSRKSYAIPTSVTDIDVSAFEGCSSLTGVEIPNSVTYIGQEAFRNCDGLTSVTIPSSVTAIHPGVFFDCDDLTRVYFQGDAPNFNEEVAGNAFSSIVIRAFPENVTLYYIKGKSGWTSPTWCGYKTATWDGSTTGGVVDFWSTMTDLIEIADYSAKLTFKDGSATYTGAAQEYKKATKPSSLKGSFTYTYFNEEGEQVSAMKDAGTYTVVATYSDTNSTGTKKATFTIKPATLTISGATASKVEYSGGTTVDPSVITAVTFKGLKGGDKLTSADYTVTSATLTKAAIGKQKVSFTVALKNPNYVFSKNSTTGKGTATIEVTGVRIDVDVKLDSTSFVYTGSAQKPTVTVTNTNTGAVVPASNYKVTYANNTKAGTAKVTVTAKSGAGFTFDTQVVNFQITKATPTLTPKALSANWTGQALADKVIKGTAKVGTKTVSGSWTWEKQPSTDVGSNVGTVRFIPKDKDNYEEATAEINVTVKGTTLTISGAKIADKSYDLDDKKPVIESVTFKSGKTVVNLELGTDYTVTGSYAKYAVGKQKVNFTVTLIGEGASKNYSLTKKSGTATGTITAPQVTISVAGLETQIYTGKAITPNITVTGTDAQGKPHTLVKNTDYTVTYKNNKAVGTASVTIKPKGKNYSFNAVTKTFDIVASKPTPVAYDLTYLLNGGSGDMPSERWDVGAAVTITSTVPTKDGYDFAGWSDGTTTYQPGGTFTMPGHVVTLTAQWSPSIFPSINDASVFLKQPVSSSLCTLFSATMMLRRQAILDRDSGWDSITDSAVRPTAWTDGVGLNFDFTYSGMRVYMIGIGELSIAEKKDKLRNMLEEHPEGIVAYRCTNGQTHAVLFTDYDASSDTFYCADPAPGSGEGRIPFAQSTIKGTTQDEKLEYLGQVWYIKSDKNK
jgi:uncharacterized repeat protein (TIGR02543 family)